MNTNEFQKDHELLKKKRRISGPFSAPYEKFRYDLLPQPSYSGGNRYNHTNIFTGILQSILTVINDLNTIIDQFSESFSFLTADQVFKLMSLLERCEFELQDLLSIFNMTYHEFPFNRESKQKLLNEITQSLLLFQQKLQYQDRIYSSAFVDVKT